MMHSPEVAILVAIFLHGKPRGGNSHSDGHVWMGGKNLAAVTLSLLSHRAVIAQATKKSSPASFG